MINNTSTSSVTDKYVGILMAFLVLHLVYSNSDLLITVAEMVLGSKLNGLQTVLRYAFAFSYSIITVIIMYLYPRFWLILTLSIFDGFAVYLKYNVNQAYFITVTAVYFGLYTMLIVIAVGLVRIKDTSKKTRKRIKKSI